MIQLRAIEVRTKTLRTVEFVCPRCEVDSAGRVIKLQRWYHVMGVPVAPMATLDSKVECDACGHRSGLGVLDIPTASQLAEWLTAAMRSAIANVARAGVGDLGLIRDDVRSAAVDVMVSAGHVYDEEMFDDDCRTLVEADTDMCLRLLRDELSSHGKQSFLQRMIAVAHADGDLTVSEHHMLVTIGASLGMAAPHINGILATAIKRYQSAG
jgi:hypothetical protein